MLQTDDTNVSVPGDSQQTVVFLREHGHEGGSCVRVIVEDAQKIVTVEFVLNVLGVKPCAVEPGLLPGLLADVDGRIPHLPLLVAKRLQSFVDRNLRAEIQDSPLLPVRYALEVAQNHLHQVVGFAPPRVGKQGHRSRPRFLFSGELKTEFKLGFISQIHFSLQVAVVVVFQVPKSWAQRIAHVRLLFLVN